MRTQEAYDVLGLPPDATMEDAKNRFHRMSLKAHPDKGGSTTMFQRILEAFNMLKEAIPLREEEARKAMEEKRRQKAAEKAAREFKDALHDRPVDERVHELALDFARAMAEMQERLRAKVGVGTFWLSSNSKLPIIPVKKDGGWPTWTRIANREGFVSQSEWNLQMSPVWLCFETSIGPNTHGLGFRISEAMDDGVGVIYESQSMAKHLYPIVMELCGGANFVRKRSRHVCRGHLFSPQPPFTVGAYRAFTNEYTYMDPQPISLCKRDRESDESSSSDSEVELCRGVPVSREFLRRR